MKKYAAVVLTVALCVVAVLTLFGDNLKALFGMSADAISGDVEVARRAPLERKSLRNFGRGTDYGASPAPAVPAPPPNPVTVTALDAQSTFAIDVDTASWTWARRVVLDLNQLPAHDGVRLEEWVNAFDYELPQPSPKGPPLAVTVEGATSPFDESKTLLKVALQGRTVTERQPAHLVFLVDVSGSMSSADRLPLAKHALKVLSRKLTERDTVALVTYAGSTQVVLPTTNGARHDAIVAAIDSLGAGGGTAMGSGMELAYRLAVQQVKPGTSTRVIVLTDGDANIGANLTADQMLSAVHAYVEEGVTLTTVGFGMGNYRGDQLERLADKGNGQALYFSNEREVEEAFDRKLTGTLQVIAKDVKVQVTFDPAVVKSYRLLGYENRAVADADFRNDRVDAGELGSGHTVTALYEVTLSSTNARLGAVAVRGTLPGSGEAFEFETPVTRAAVSHALAEQGADFRFAAAVAMGADTLRGNAVGSWSLTAIAELAERASAGRPERQEFVAFLRRAEQLRLNPVAALRPVDNGAY